MVFALTVAAAPGAAEVIQTEEGQLLAPTPVYGVGYEEHLDDVAPYDGVSYDEFDLHDQAPGASFELTATEGLAFPTEELDLDVCFFDEADRFVNCAATPGNESGTVPETATRAGVYLRSGADVGFRLTVAG